MKLYTIIQKALILIAVIASAQTSALAASDDAEDYNFHGLVENSPFEGVSFEEQFVGDRWAVEANCAAPARELNPYAASALRVYLERGDMANVALLKTLINSGSDNEKFAYCVVCNFGKPDDPHHEKNLNSHERCVALGILPASEMKNQVATTE